MEVNLNNYEEYLLSHVDGELDKAETTALMKFLQAHPDKRKELTMLQMATLPAEKEIHFPDKQLLYKEERPQAKKTFVLRRYSWLSAAAAACIALLVVFYIYPKDGTLAVNSDVAVNKPASADRPQVKPVPPHQDSVTTSVAITDKEKEYKPGTPTFRQKIKTKEQQTARTSIAAASIPVSPKENEIETNETQPPLPILSSPDISVTDSVKDIALAANRVTIKQESNPVQEAEINNIRESGSAKANRKDGAAESRITNATETFAMAKQNLDSAITQKLININQKTSGFISHVAKNGIKIGHITFAFNN